MDSLITAAARALAAGDPLGALKRVALRDDAPALALRGIAMAQLGDFPRAKSLLKSAARAFGAKEAVAARAASSPEAEIALAARDLGWSAAALAAARATLEERGDHVERRACGLPRGPPTRSHRTPGRGRTRARGARPAPLPPATRTAHELVVAGIAIRRLRTVAAQAALARARSAARQARIPALSAEVEARSCCSRPRPRA
jgi:hypothetical protein